MAWGWLGALAGAGAAVLFAPFTGGASLAAVPKFLLLAGAGAALGAGAGGIVGSVVKSNGDTPKNELKELGVDPNKLHEEAKEYRDKRKDFLENLNKEDQKKVAELEDALKALDETIKNLKAEIASMDDSDPQKAVKTAQLNNVQVQRDETKKELDQYTGKIAERNEKIDKIFKEAGDPVGQTRVQYNNKMNTPRWNSYKNWGIIAVGVVIFFILISFLRKLLNQFLSSMK